MYRTYARFNKIMHIPYEHLAMSIRTPRFVHWRQSLPRHCCLRWTTQTTTAPLANPIKI